jgi:hypothetical protein
LRNYLGKRPGEARRVAFYGKLNEQIQRSFGPTDEPPPTHAPAERWATGTAGKWLAWRGGAARLQTVRTSMALIFAAALVLVAASGWMAASQVSPEALNNAAVMALMQASGSHDGSAQPLADRSAGGGTVGAMAATATAPASAGGQNPGLAAHQNPPVLDASAPDLTGVGMHLISHRTLTLGPFTHATEYLYLNTEHQPIVLLKAAAWIARAQPQWSAHRVGSLRLLGWTAHGERYVLAGTADARGLMRAADALTMH